MPRLRSASALACCLVSMALGAQQEKSAPRGSAPTTRDSDPYTAGTAEAVARAGYANLGPFPIGEHHGSDDVDALIGPGRMQFIETEHLKLGVQLPLYAVAKGDARQRRKLKQELTELKLRIPSVDEQARVLDPWLRAHLFAHRCESTYAAFLRRFGPPPRVESARGSRAVLDDRAAASGPFLGKAQKFVVLVFADGADFTRYSAQFLGTAFRAPQRHDLGPAEGFLFGTASNFGVGLADDTALHCHVVYSLTQNFCDGFGGHLYQIPVWWKTGLAQCFSRAIDERFPNYDRAIRRTSDRKLDARADLDWLARSRSLVESGSARPWTELAVLSDYQDFEVHDFVVAWSRVDFLLSKGDAAMARFVQTMKTPLPSAPGWRDWSRILEVQDAALREAFAVSELDELDRAWKDWVRRRR